MSHEPQARTQFLIEMYKQMWANINRHIVVLWQSVSVLLGTFAVFALIEKRVVSLDFASALIVVIAGWVIAHVIDANYWYNRNLAIIVNIERQFLSVADLQLIHPYFGERRRTTILDHLKIQAALASGVYILVILYHFFDRVWPGIGGHWNTFEVAKTSPYVVTIACVYLLSRHERKQRSAYARLLQRSPGAIIEELPNSNLTPEE